MCIVSHIKTISSPFVLVTFNVYTCIKVWKNTAMSCALVDFLYLPVCL